MLSGVGAGSEFEAPASGRANKTATGQPQKPEIRSKRVWFDHKLRPPPAGAFILLVGQLGCSISSVLKDVAAHGGA